MCVLGSKTQIQIESVDLFMENAQLNMFRGLFKL